MGKIFSFAYGSIENRDKLGNHHHLVSVQRLAWIAAARETQIFFQNFTLDVTHTKKLYSIIGPTWVSFFKSAVFANEILL